jgi:hypothetical protein
MVNLNCSKIRSCSPQKKYIYTQSTIISRMQTWYAIDQAPTPACLAPITLTPAPAKWSSWATSVCWPASPSTIATSSTPTCSSGCNRWIRRATVPAFKTTSSFPNAAGKRRPSSPLSPKCYDYGEGDELITPVYIGPKDVGGGLLTSSTSSPPQWSVPCGDDEDCPYWEGVEGSGRRNDKDDSPGGRKCKL